MNAILPASLDAVALSRRLGELAGHERELQLEFLLHLDEYDRRRAYVEAGYSSLWDYLTKALHYREGATHRRIRAMKALRRAPAVGEALRDGRLCLTTLAVLEPILTLENADELVARAAYASKLDAERLVAGAQPKLAPRDGVRAIARQEGATNQAMSAAGSGDFSFAIPAVANGPDESTVSQQQVDVARRGANATPTRPTLQAVSAEDFSLRVTIDAQLKADLDTLRDLLAHKVPNGDLRAVLREAVACAIEKHGKRRGAVEPKRQRAPAKAKATSANETAPVARAPSAEVRRQVWKRDGGRCAWTAPDGHRCGSTWKLEVDHVDAAALGGLPTVENCRLLCRSHNMAHAEATFGREHMERFRRKADHGRSAVSSREVAANDTTPLRTPASSGAA